MKLSIIRRAALLAVLLSAGTAMADTHFSMGVNDTLRISPAYLGKAFQATVRAHLEEMYDSWNLTMSYPEGLHALDASGGPGLTVPYLNSQGDEVTLTATLLYNQDKTAFTANTGSATGYCDYWGTGDLVSYGTVKWEVGDYDEMFSIVFYVDEDFEGGDVTINGRMSAQPDPRDGGNGRGLILFRRITVLVEALKGDVNGDGKVNISDVTLLISYLMSDSGNIDRYAADMNGDTDINITDCTKLINYLTTQ